MVACKIEHRIPTGRHNGHEYFRIGVLAYENGQYPDVKRVFAPVLCMHCRNAPCIHVCPVPGALYRDETGIVIIDGNRCDGCKRCIRVCPYNAVYFDEENHVADKCDLCADRIMAGLEPACVSACMGRAMIFGDLDDPESKISTTLSKRTVEPVGLLWPQYFDTTFQPSVFYAVLRRHFITERK
jgi:tetrathionate reductase subunit B